ncbi:MAG: hypothetical protein ABI702_16905 [Burkholderiales bacterium]
MLTPTEAYEIYRGLRASYRTLRLVTRVCDEYSAINKAETTQDWLAGIRRVEESEGTWEAAATRFQTADNPATLIDTYYRGLPHMLLGAMSQAADLNVPWDWSIQMIEAATLASRKVERELSSIPKEVRRIHRSQVFPLIPAIQCLPIVTNEAHAELCSRVAGMLQTTQAHGPGYTPSACDQINQIVPQTLIDQLLAGPHSWANFYVRNDVLSALMAPAYAEETAEQFETGIAFGLQFLAYYRRSLVSRKNLPPWAIGQHQRIENFFADLKKATSPTLRRLAIWGSR